MSNLRTVTGLLMLTLVMAGTALSQSKGESPGRTLLSHNVYFSLNNPSDAAREKLVAACRKYLSGHPGTVFFAAGVLAGELDRPVNDRDFDVALNVIFDSREAHDRYQKDARHLKFIEENTSSWKKVRVFDSYVGK
jgi:hypothetical protein